jgi:hypothetical protein
MPAFNVEFEVVCAECGTGLCRESDTEFDVRYGRLRVIVGVCKNCRDKSKSEGYKEGYDEGLRDGRYEELERDKINEN